MLISDNQRLKVLLSELEASLHAQTCKIIERGCANEAKGKKGGKEGWNVGWWFNMGRTVQQEGFAPKLDGTCAFETPHPWHKKKSVYMDDPLTSASKPYWKKELYILAGQVLEIIDVEYMRDGDWCLYVSCMLAGKCEVKRHEDRKDVSHQYIIFLGNYKNAVLELESPREDSKGTLLQFSESHKVLKCDARCKHRVASAGFEGVRYCVTLYKMYDRRLSKPTPVYWPPHYV